MKNWIILMLLALASISSAKTTDFILNNGFWDNPAAWTNGIPDTNGVDTANITVNCNMISQDVNCAMIFIYAKALLFCKNSMIRVTNEVYMSASTSIYFLNHCRHIGEVGGTGTFSAHYSRIIANHLTNYQGDHNLISTTDWIEGDFNLDEIVNFYDLAILAENWLE